MSEKIDYSKGIYDARQLGAGRMFILGVQHMFAMFGARSEEHTSELQSRE